MNELTLPSNPVVILYTASMREKALSLQKMLSDELHYQTVLMEECVVADLPLITQVRIIFEASTRFILIKSADLMTDPHIHAMLDTLMTAAFFNQITLVPVEYSRDAFKDVFFDNFAPVRLYPIEGLDEEENRLYLAEKLQSLINML